MEDDDNKLKAFLTKKWQGVPYWVWGVGVLAVVLVFAG